jgi:hypothetical protein
MFCIHAEVWSSAGKLQVAFLGGCAQVGQALACPLLILALMPSNVTKTGQAALRSVQGKQPVLLFWVEDGKRHQGFADQAAILVGHIAFDHAGGPSLTQDARVGLDFAVLNALEEINFHLDGDHP